MDFLAQNDIHAIKNIEVETMPKENYRYIKQTKDVNSLRELNRLAYTEIEYVMFINQALLKKQQYQDHEDPIIHTYVNDKIEIEKLRFSNHPNHGKCFSFTIVRNPYNRFLSAYNYLYGEGIGSTLDKKYSTILKSYESFEHFVNNLHILKFEIVHLVEQNIFVCDTQDNIIVDFVGKYENLDQDIKKVSIVNTLHLCIKNKSQKYVNDIPDELKQKIYQEYKKDFIIFGYDK